MEQTNTWGLTKSTLPATKAQWPKWCSEPCSWYGFSFSQHELQIHPHLLANPAHPHVETCIHLCILCAHRAKSARSPHPLTRAPHAPGAHRSQDCHKSKREGNFGRKATAHNTEFCSTVNFAAILGDFLPPVFSIAGGHGHVDPWNFPNLLNSELQKHPSFSSDVSSYVCHSKSPRQDEWNECGSLASDEPRSTPAPIKANVRHRPMLLELAWGTRCHKCWKCFGLSFYKEAFNHL